MRRAARRGRACRSSSTRTASTSSSRSSGARATVLTPHAGELGRLLGEESAGSTRTGSRPPGAPPSASAASSCSRARTRSSPRPARACSSSRRPGARARDGGHRRRPDGRRRRVPRQGHGAAPRRRGGRGRARARRRGRLAAGRADRERRGRRAARARSPGERLDVVTGAFSYTGPPHRAPAAAPTGGACARSRARRRQTAAERARAGAAPVRRPPRARREPARRGHALQHVLDPLRARRRDLRRARSRTRARSSPPRARPASAGSSTSASRTRREDSPLAVLPRQGAARAGAAGVRRSRTRSCGRRWSSGSLDILVNNIAWMLRRLPLFLVAGDGRYRVQPVSARTSRRSAWTAAREDEDVVVDAAGPETYTFAELVRLVGVAVGARRRSSARRRGLVLAPRRPRRPAPARRRCSRATSSRACGRACSSRTSRRADARASASGWPRTRDGLGRRYVSELARNYRRSADRSELTIDLGAVRRNARDAAGARSRAPSSGRSSRRTATGTAPSTSAGAALEAGATALCVATVPEALVLRRGARRRARILVLGPGDEPRGRRGARRRARARRSPTARSPRACASTSSSTRAWAAGASPSCPRRGARSSA